MSDVACRWIEDNYRANPFLLWLEYFDVHEPWFPPDYLVRKYQPGYDGEPMAHPNYGSADVYSPDELRNMQARYASMCTLLSRHVGRVLRVADDCNLFENTIVVFLCDHGTFLGEHGLTGKSFIDPDTFDVAPFHREITRICWTMSVPESLGCMTKQPAGGLRQLVQAPDLMPTVLDLCRIETPAEAEIEGVSLVPLLKGETTESPRETAVTAWTTRTQDASMMYCRRPAITDGEWTLIVTVRPRRWSGCRPRMSAWRRP